MLIEKFEIYKYENVFYTKEELEQMGFVYMESREDYVSLKDISSKIYEITEKSGSCETVHSIQDYLSFDDNQLAGKFLFNFGYSGLILDVKKYYGISCKYEEHNKKEIIQLFESESIVMRHIQKLTKQYKTCLMNFQKKYIHICVMKLVLDLLSKIKKKQQDNMY